MGKFSLVFLLFFVGLHTSMMTQLTIGHRLYPTVSTADGILLVAIAFGIYAYLKIPGEPAGRRARKRPQT